MEATKLSARTRDRTASPPSPTTVMLWDPATESFAQMTIESHSSGSQHTDIPPTPHPLKRSASVSHSPRRQRLSGADSMLDFGEFLKDLHCDRPQSPSSGWDASRQSVDEHPIRRIPPSKFEPQEQSPRDIAVPSWKSSKVLKTALKEVLGGGGNNKDMPKDSTVSVR